MKPNSLNMLVLGSLVLGLSACGGSDSSTKRERVAAMRAAKADKVASAAAAKKKGNMVATDAHILSKEEKPKIILVNKDIAKQALADNKQGIQDGKLVEMEKSKLDVEAGKAIACTLAITEKSDANSLEKWVGESKGAVIAEAAPEKSKVRTINLQLVEGITIECLKQNSADAFTVGEVKAALKGIVDIQLAK